MEKEVRKNKRLQLNAAIERKISEMQLSKYRVAKNSGLTATQIKDMLEKDYAYTTDSLIALLSALGVDLLGVIKCSLSNESK